MESLTVHQQVLGAIVAFIFIGSFVAYFIEKMIEKEYFKARNILIGVIFSTLIGLVLVSLKLTDIISWRWIFVTLPLILVGLFVVMTALAMLVIKYLDKQ